MYKDINVYSPTTKPEIDDLASIRQSILNLILTRPTERPFNPEYGIAMDALLFDLADDATALGVFSEIVDKVARFEPRVKLNSGLTTVVGDLDNNSIKVSIAFEVNGFEGNIFEVSQTISR